MNTTATDGTTQPARKQATKPSSTCPTCRSTLIVLGDSAWCCSCSVAVDPDTRRMLPGGGR